MEKVGRQEEKVARKYNWEKRKRGGQSAGRGSKKKRERNEKNVGCLGGGSAAITTKK